MKKALAVLVIMMVALTSVFAENSSITLKHEIPSSIEWQILYGYNADATTNFLEQTEDVAVNLTQGGNINLSVKVKSNAAVVTRRTYEFSSTDFSLYDVDGQLVTENVVETRLSFAAPETQAGTNWTSANKGANEVGVVLNANKRMSAFEEVASGVLSWDPASDLVAGTYKATITVTITDGQ